MPHERFYSEEELQALKTVALTGKELHHLKVMRILPNDLIELVNGKGVLAKGRALEISKDHSLFKILSIEEKEPPSPSIALAIPLMRASKLDFVFEKATELGADRFLLYPAEHSEIETLSSSKLERFRLLTISAMKQSGRLFLPSIELLPNLEKCLAFEGEIFHGDSSAPLDIGIGEAEKILFITGPEKGFSKKEEELLLKTSRKMRLSPYILRAETAPLAAAALLSQKTLS